MTLLLADAGATKTDWVKISISPEGDNREKIYSGAGINPNLHDTDTIQEELRMVRASLGDDFTAIRFYGAGIGSATLKAQMETALSEAFNCDDIRVESDMSGAARSVLGTNSGIACIMGTGSNSCHYDGKEIDYRPASLGYLLDDAGGGFAFSGRLLSDLFKGLAPDDLKNDFDKRYDLSVKDLVEHLYHWPAPNSWIAGFMPFVIEHSDHTYVSEMIDDQIRVFFDREFHSYPERLLTEEGIGFVGSVASLLSERIKVEMARRGWRLTSIVAKPIESLKRLDVEELIMKSNSER